MERLLSLPLPLPLPLLLLLVLVAGSRGALASGSVVEETCARATSRGGRAELAPFCVASLQAAPGSDRADARGLAAIATNLTLANYTAAVATVKALQRRAGLPEAERRALATCRERYIEALNVVHSAVHALATRDARAYAADMGVVRSAATRCDEAFGVGGAAAEAPMRKANEDAVSLATVAMLIVSSLPE